MPERKLRHDLCLQMTTANATSDIGSQCQLRYGMSASVCIADFQQEDHHLECTERMLLHAYIHADSVLNTESAFFADLVKKMSGYIFHFCKNMVLYMISDSTPRWIRGFLPVLHGNDRL